MEPWTRDKWPNLKGFNIKKTEHQLMLGLTTLLTLAITVFIYSLGISLARYHLGDSLEEMGQIGDAFNIVTAISSVLAFIGLMATIILTQRQFTQQQNEVRDQFAKQQFEGHVFQLISNWRDERDRLNATYLIPRSRRTLTNNIEIEQESGTGIEAMKICLKRLKVNLKKYDGGNHHHKQIERRNQIEDAYMEAIRDSNIDAGHYFRMFYHILKLIDEEKTLRRDPTRRKSLIGMIRSHISDTEFVLIFYNCLTSFGYEKMYPLIEQYDLLQNMQLSSIYPPQDLTLYPMFFTRLCGRGELQIGDIESYRENSYLDDLDIDLMVEIRKDFDMFNQTYSNIDFAKAVAKRDEAWRRYEEINNKIESLGIRQEGERGAEITDAIFSR